MRRATPSGPGEAVGTVTIADSAQGAVIKTDLKGLPPGPHGFHVHETQLVRTRDSKRPRPFPPGRPAGISTRNTPASTPARRARAISAICRCCRLPPTAAPTETLTAPRIKEVSMLRGKAVMIHAGGDNYSDQPAPLGGGGARIACGVLQ